MQSLAVPLRHHRDFRRNMIDDIVSSQLGCPAGVLAGSKVRAGPARKRKHATRRTSMRDIPAKTP
jgi:hypothetical protein